MGATMKDIAKRTGLGLATISSYLNGGNVREKNRIKIEEAIEELHFEVNEVARGLKTNRTKTIGIVIPELNNIFFAEIITETEDILRNHGYATMICDCRSDEKREEEAEEFLFQRRVDGLILMPTGNGEKGIQRFLRAGKPVVLIDRKMEQTECDCVLVDNEGAARDALERLFAAGHRKIGIIVGPDNIYTAKERLSGYRKAFCEKGLTPEKEMIARGDYTIAGGARAMRELMEKNKEMTAVFISNYEMTVGAMMELNDLGVSVPEELSVIGFDNEDFAKALRPRLSIVTQPSGEIARCAAELLLRRLERETSREPKIKQSAGSGEEQPETRQPGNSKGEKPEMVTLKTGFVEGRSVKCLSDEERFARES